MFGLFRKKRKEKNVKETKTVSMPLKVEGMFCPECGYMVAEEEPGSLPVEGYAICPNCGGLLKRGVFRRGDDGVYSLLEKSLQKKKKRTTSGGHYRVRPAGRFGRHVPGNGNILRRR